MEDLRIGPHLKALGNIMKRYFENASTINYARSLTGENTFIIRYLAEMEEQGEPVYQKAIENRFSITRSTTSKVLTLMENKNLIKRISVPGDKRLKRIALTDEARELHQKIMMEINAFEETMKQGLSQEEIKQFLSTIETIKQNLEHKDQA